MESMAYITKTEVDLTDIQEIADALSYRTQRFFEHREQLNIIFSEDDSMWCYWVKATEADLFFDDEDDYELLRTLAPQSMFVLEYHANTLPVLAAFYKKLLQQYGGWVDCRSGLKTAFTLETIENIVTGCP